MGADPRAIVASWEARTGLASAARRFFVAILAGGLERPLGLDQPRVVRAGHKQLRMRPVANDTAPVEHDDPVGGEDRRRAVSDHVDGATSAAVPSAARSPRSLTEFCCDTGSCSTRTGVSRSSAGQALPFAVGQPGASYRVSESPAPAPRSAGPPRSGAGQVTRPHGWPGSRPAHRAGHPNRPPRVRPRALRATRRATGRQQ